MSDAPPRPEPAPEACPREPERGLLAKLGPGLITGASDDDPSGIATYSQVGSKFGFGLLWTLLFSYPLMVGIQNVSARVGRVTGRGLAANLSARYPRGLVHLLTALLLVANTVNLAADLGAMGAALGLLVPGPPLLYTAAFALGSAVLLVLVPYRRYVPYLKWLTLALFAYVGVLFAVRIPWGQVAWAALVPRIQRSRDFATAIVAVFGTTISPYLFFWQAATEVEEQQLDPCETPLKRAPEQAPRQLERVDADTWIGMGVSNLIAFFIMLTTAVTLHAHGVTEIETSSQAAEALRPVAGRLAFLLFSLGIVGTGLLAAPVLAGASAYALAEAFRWRKGLERRPRQAPRFYAVIAGSFAVALLLNFVRLDPIKALYWSAVINGLTAVPIMAMVMHLAGRKEVMGEVPLPLWLKVLGWAATLVMAALAVAMFAAR